MIIIFGPYRQNMLLNELYKREQREKRRVEEPDIPQQREIVAIPNLSCHPVLAQRLIDGYRGATELLHDDLDVIVTTSCKAVLDCAIPGELRMANIRGLTIDSYESRVDHRKEFLDAHETGIQHISEILLTKGLWFQDGDM